jgi:hypothetical protein
VIEEPEDLPPDGGEPLAAEVIGEPGAPVVEAEELADEPEEVVDGLPVPSSHTRVLESLDAAPVPARQAAALAATGFVAGAATVALVQRRRVKVAAKRSGRGKKRNAIGEIVSSNSFLVDVHLLRRD